MTRLVVWGISHGWRRRMAIESDGHAVMTMTRKTRASSKPLARWLNVMKQRLYVLGVDCQHIAAGRAVVKSSPAHRGIYCETGYFEA
jgi:hypothetical protein